MRQAFKKRHLQRRFLRRRHCPQSLSNLGQCPPASAASVKLGSTDRTMSSRCVSDRRLRSASTERFRELPRATPPCCPAQHQTPRACAAVQKNFLQNVLRRSRVAQNPQRHRIHQRRVAIIQPPPSHSRHGRAPPATRRKSLASPSLRASSCAV